MVKDRNVTGQLHVTVGGSSTTPSPTTSPSSVGISLPFGSPPGVGTTSQYIAIATFPNTTTDVTLVSTWSSSNTSVATVNRGAVTGVGAGQADISAIYQNVSGTIHLVIASPSTPACVYSAFPGTLSVPANGGTATVTVSASGNNCSWTAKSNDSFITITSGASGTANGATFISVAANSGVARTGTLTIAGQQVTISQAGGQASPNCAATLLPTSADYSAEFKQGTVTVTVSPGGDGSVQRLTVTFEQHCEGFGPALRGKIVYVR